MGLRVTIFVGRGYFTDTFLLQKVSLSVRNRLSLATLGKALGQIVLSTRITESPLIMCLKNILTARVLLWILNEDQTTAQTYWKTICRHCRKGILHWNNRTRKVRLPNGIIPPENFDIHFSLCCSKKGCRRRFNPPSLRFVTHGVFSAAVVALVRVFSDPSSEKKTKSQTCFRFLQSQLDAGL